MLDYDALGSLLKETGGVVIGYSGGVDSTLLAVAATEVLGEQAVCVLVESCLNPEAEMDDAVANAENLGLNLVRLQVDALGIEHVPENKSDRCYHCKMAIFTRLVKIASERGIECVLDGANADDESDYRPGSVATRELGVRSPLKELGFTKERIRAISREQGLPTWNKPSYACLASRVPYGTPLTYELLEQIDRAEQVLRNLGFTQFRVRHHGNLARIELMQIEMDKMIIPGVRQLVLGEFNALGYKYVSMDLAGYRTGSMNETL